ncbi:MAG: hypothetical protein NVSMB66_6180 [Candidatus Doudnabacteria bacterium]
MPEIVFATPETIKHPAGGLVVTLPQPEDYVMGGPNVFEPIVADGHWTPFMPAMLRQGNIYFDTWGCVSFSLNNNHKFIHKALYGTEIDACNRFLTVGSGTKPSYGNDKRTVAEWKRKNGYLKEEEWPLTPTMQIDEYYNGGVVPQNLLSEGLSYGKNYDFFYQWLGNNNLSTIMNGLKYSPVQVDIDGYLMNDKGYVINNGRPYIHEIDIFDYEGDFNNPTCLHGYDSERDQFVKFDPSYSFGSPMIHSLKKKYMPTLYKLNSNPAIYFLNPDDQHLVAFADGVVPGGSLFKTFFGGYSNVKINHVDVLPYPIATYQITTK